MSEISNERIVTFSSKLNYGIGQIAEGLKNTSFNLFLLFYYNHVLGVRPEWCGAALAIALIFDAVSDPLAGSLSDNWRSRWGRRHPFMYASAIPLGIAFYFLFSPPELSEFGLFLWLLSFAVLTRAAMTLYHVPHIALGAEMTNHFEERTVIVSFRMAFGYIGGMLTALIGFMLFFAASPEFPNGQLNPDAYSPFALLLSILMVITIIISAQGTLKELPYLPKLPDNQPKVNLWEILVRVFTDTWQAIKNKSFRWLFLGVLIVFIMVGVDNALNLYVNTFFWELTPNQIMIFTIAAIFGVVLGTMFTARLHKYLDKRPAVMFGTAWWALLQIIPIVLRLLDMFPENGTDTLFYTLVSIKFIQGVGVAQALVSFNSMMADVVDEHELRTHRRQEGIFFGAVAFSGKAASGVGIFLAGLAINFIQWPEGARTADEIPADTLFSLGVVYGQPICKPAARNVIKKAASATVKHITPRAETTNPVRTRV
ncbi:MAG: MFS transporter [Pseudomonadota bacterium]